MINRLFTLLRSPYPVLMKRWKAVLIPSCIVFIILFLFQPFGISQMGADKIWVLLGYGLVSWLALSITIYLLPVLLPRFHREQNWTFGKQLLATFSSCLLIAVGNWIYTSCMFGWHILSWRGFMISLVWVAALAPFPITFFLMWERNLQLARNLKEALEMNLILSKREDMQKEMKRTEEEETGGIEPAETPARLVFSGGTKERLEVDAYTLLYIEAEGNYVRIAYRSAGRVQQKLVRATMKQAEEAAEDCPYILRCHRAFLVNMCAVVKVDGNSQGYRLRLEGCEEEVPVSRAYAKAVKMRIESSGEG